MPQIHWPSRISFPCEHLTSEYKSIEAIPSQWEIKILSPRSLVKSGPFIVYFHNKQFPHMVRTPLPPHTPSEWQRDFTSSLLNKTENNQKVYKMFLPRWKWFFPWNPSSLISKFKFLLNWGPII